MDYIAKQVASRPTFEDVRRRHYQTILRHQVLSTTVPPWSHNRKEPAHTELDALEKLAANTKKKQMDCTQTFLTMSRCV